MSSMRTEIQLDERPTPEKLDLIAIETGMVGLVRLHLENSDYEGGRNNPPNSVTHQGIDLNYDEAIALSYALLQFNVGRMDTYLLNACTPNENGHYQAIIKSRTDGMIALAVNYFSDVGLSRSVAVALMRSEAQFISLTLRAVAEARKIGDLEVSGL